MVRWNKPIGSWKLPCAVISSNQTTWSTVLAWIEYAHNFMTSSTTAFTCLNPLWDISLRCFLQQWVSALFYLCCIISAGASGCGGCSNLPAACTALSSSTELSGSASQLPPNGLGVYLYVPLRTKSRKVSFHWPMWGWFYGKSCFSLSFSEYEESQCFFHVSQLKPVISSALCVPSLWITLWICWTLCD